MSLRSPTLAEILNNFSERIQGEVNVCLPGKIESYDASTQLAKVKPLLKRPLVGDDGVDIDAESIPVINNVPVVHPSGGGYFAHFPLAAGDPVTLVFSDRSLDRWLDKGGEVDPGFAHTHELTDAFAIPGGRSKQQKLSNPSSSKLVIGKDGDAHMQITIDGTTIKLSDNASNFVALANLVKTELDALRTALNSLVTTYNSHTHPYVDTPAGAAVTSPTLSTGSPANPVNEVAAAKVKAE